MFDSPKMQINLTFTFIFISGKDKTNRSNNGTLIHNLLENNI